VCVNNREIPGNTKLKTLDLSWNHLRKQEMYSVAQAVSPNTTLSTLWLAWNGVGDLSPPHAPQPDEDHIDVNKPVKTGKGNKTSAAIRQGADDKHALVEMIAMSRSLTDLDLSNCRLGANLGKALAAAIRANSSLEALKLDNNAFGEAGEGLMAALRIRQEGSAHFKYTCDNISFDPSTQCNRQYDASNPPGHYLLDLSLPADQTLAKLLVKDAKSSCGDMWRCEKLNGVRFNYPTERGAKWAMPTSGILELHLCSSAQCLEDATEREAHSATPNTLHPHDFSKFYKVLQNSASDGGRLTMLKRACQAYLFDISQVLMVLLLFQLDRTREAAMVLLVNKTTDQDKLFSVLTVFSEGARLRLHQKLGAVWFWNSAFPRGKYWLDLGKKLDRDVLQRLLVYQQQHADKARFGQIRFAALPGHTLTANHDIGDVMESDDKNNDDTARLKTEGIVELEFIIHTPHALASDIVHCIKKQQKVLLEAEIAHDLAEEQVRMATPSGSRIHNRAPTTRPSSQSSRPVTSRPVTRGPPLPPPLPPHVLMGCGCERGMVAREERAAQLVGHGAANLCRLPQLLILVGNRALEKEGSFAK